MVCRYVERNPLRAGLVKRAEEWKHGSLYRWNQAAEPAPAVLSRWPIARLRGWNRRVNQALTDRELAAVRTCIDRGRPFGDEDWVERTAEQQGLQYTLHPVGRPRKKPMAAK